MSNINEHTNNMMNKIIEQYVNEYYSKYDKEHHVWRYEVPTVKESIISLIPEKNIVKYVRNFSDNKNGFMFSSGPEISRIQELWYNHGHSGASAACCLRICQSIFTKIFDEQINLIV